MRRVLTFALAGILALETPMAVCAAETDTVWEGTADGEECLIVGDDTGDHENSGDSDEIDDNENCDDSEKGDDTDSGDTADDAVQDGAEEQAAAGSAESDEMPEEESGITVSENALSGVMAVEPSSEESITAISYEEAKNGGVTISAPDSRERKAWYSFTAPGAGRYAFYTDSRDCAGAGDIYVNLCAKPSAAAKNHGTHFNPTSTIYYYYLWISTDYMEQGETVYIETYVSNDSAREFTLKAADETRLTADENGACSIQRDNGDKLTVRAQAGFERLRFSAQADNSEKLEGQYFIRPYWCPADHSAGDLDTNEFRFDKFRIELKRDNQYTGEILSDATKQGQAYDISYILLYTADVNPGTAQFVALLTGTEVAAREDSSEEWLYIHASECGEHSIALDVEPFQTGNSKTIYCYYAPTDGSEPERSAAIDKWTRYVFDDLRSGTAYRFSFRTSAWGAPLKEVVYQTAGEPAKISVYDYKAVLDEDFNGITVSAKTNYQDDSCAYLNFRLRDELGNLIHKGYATDAAKTPVSEQVTELSYRYGIGTEIVLLPDRTYEVEVWVEFKDARVAAERQTILLHTPEKAYYGEDELDLQVTRDSGSGTTAACRIRVPDGALLKTQSYGVYYKPAGDAAYRYKSVGLYGTTEESFPVENLQNGAAYDFRFCYGGVMKTCTLKLNDSGIELERTEDGGTDYVGPYDFVRTYRLLGVAEDGSEDYYLRLQCVRAEDWNKSFDRYDTIGPDVTLNAADEYQTTFLSAAGKWLQPDTEYYLRLLVGKSAGFSKDDAVCCLYDSLTTAPASPLKIEETGYMRYRVTLDEKDVANLKAGERSGKFAAYIRKEGASVYMRYPENPANQYEFTAKNNYSCELSSMDLASNSRYELYLGLEGEVKYAQGFLTTGEVTQTLIVDSLKVMTNTVRIDYTMHDADADQNPYVVCYRRKAGSTAWLGKVYSGQTQGAVTLENLQADTAYEYKIGLGSGISTPVHELWCVQEGSFTTCADTRKLSVLSVSQGMFDAVIICSLSGMEHADETDKCLVCYVRPMGDGTQKQNWKKADSKVVGDKSECTLQIKDLAEGTAYEYKIGLGRASNTAEKDLKCVAAGDFATWRDTREAKLTAEPKVLSAGIGYTLQGMEHADGSYLSGYIREAAAGGAGDAPWRHQFSVPVDSRSTAGSERVTELKAGTGYEMTVGFSDSKDAGADRLKHAGTIAFTTLADGRKVSGAKADVKDAGVVLSALFTGNIEPQPSYVLFFYKAKSETGYCKAEYAENVSVVESRECSVTLTNLVKNTEYEFAAVIADTRKGVSDPDSVTDTERKTTGEFKTAPAVAPVQVTLSQEKLYLNAGDAYREQKGYGYEELSVSCLPDNSDRDFLWESSKPDVAAVSADGRVSAVGAGTAEITAASLYDPAVRATCQVTVGRYQIGRPDSAGEIQWQDAAVLNAVKNRQYDGYRLYDLSTGTPVELADAAAASDNETVASWDAGQITARQTGTAKLVFTSSDFVRAYMTVAVQSAEGKGFNITGFTASNSNYPAVPEEEPDEGRAQYTLACRDGLTYTAVGEIVPGAVPFRNSDFIWSIDNGKVAEVDAAGRITPRAAGRAVLRVTPKAAGETDGAPYTGRTLEVSLSVKELASEQLEHATPVYALANICNKIGDVRMPAEAAWEGWSWQEPATPLVINGVNRESYPFRAAYTGEEYYPEEKTIDVYIAKVTGMSVYEDAEQGHNKVLEVGAADENGNPAAGADRLTLTVKSLYYGVLNPDEKTNYYLDVDVKAPAGVTVQKGDFRTEDGRLCRDFQVTAGKAGSYTLTALIRVKDKNNSHEKILAKMTYKIKAVAGRQAYVTLTPETTDDVIFDDGRVIIDNDAAVAGFTVRAELTDRNQEKQESFDALKLAWSVTDRKVVAVQPSKDTRSAQITVKGEGHAILTAKVRDAAGHKAALRIEIQNNAPRISTEKVTVNMAFDYDTAAGRELARASSGTVEIVTAYGDSLKGVRLYDSDRETPCTKFHMISLSSEQNRIKLVVGDSGTTRTGVYDCYLGVRTKRKGEEYFYPLQVTVKNRQARVSVRSNRAANLFYRSEPASADIGVPDGVVIDSVLWQADAADPDHGFSQEPFAYAYDTNKKTGKAQRFYFRQGDIPLTDQKKPADMSAFSGTVLVKCKGYKEANDGVRVTLRWSYKKPAIVTDKASVTLLPAMAGKNVGRFDLYNKTDKVNLSYQADSYAGSNPKFYYNELSCDNPNITFLPNSNAEGWRRYRYNGGKTKGSEKLTLTVRNSDWREPVNASHTVKLAAPAPCLTVSHLTVNTARVGTAYTQVALKNAHDSGLSCDNIVIEGADKKAGALLADDLLEISQDQAQKDRIAVRVNRADTMGQNAIKNGTYTFQVTPCYTDACGNAVRAKKLKLRIQVTNRPVTAKVKLSGSLDLTKEIGSNSANYISMKTTLQNIGDDYTIQSNIKLYGEYSRYFDLKLLKDSQGEYISGQYRLRIKKDGMLKAGQRYKLALGCTVALKNGDTFTVRSQTFTVTPKQSQPKLRLTDNNQTLYAASDDLARTYGLEILSEGGYRIVGASGGLDCNKDGRPDLVVTGGSGSQKANLSVAVADRDGVMTVTGSKGRTYTIPIVVQLRGRDGIAKDMKLNVRVTVKR